MREWKLGDKTITDALKAWYILPTCVREYAVLADWGKDESIPAMGCRLFVDGSRNPGEVHMVGYQFVGHDAVGCGYVRIFVTNATH